MRAAGALGGDGGWRWTPRILVVIDGVCAPAWAAITSELSLAYIGTASRTVQRDELKPRSRRFRLGGKKEAAGVCRGLGRYRDIYIYGFSIAFFLIGLHSSCEFAEFRAIRHGCFSIRLFMLTSTTARAPHAAAAAAPAASFITGYPEVIPKRV